jgi:hypothetical protein
VDCSLSVGGTVLLGGTDDVGNGVLDVGGGVVGVEDGGIVVEEDVGGGEEEGSELVGGRVALLLEEDGGKSEVLGVEVGVADGVVLEAGAESELLVLLADGGSVGDVGNSVPVLLVEDIVNCLNTSLSGRLYMAMSARKNPMTDYQSITVRSDVYHTFS